MKTRNRIPWGAWLLLLVGLALLAPRLAFAQAGTTWTTELGGTAATAATELTNQVKPGAAGTLWFEPASTGNTPDLVVGDSCGAVGFEVFSGVVITPASCEAPGCADSQNLTAVTDRDVANGVRNLRVNVTNDGGADGSVKVSCLPGVAGSGAGGGGPGSDTTAIHDNQSGEIAAITEQNPAIATDWVLIEQASGNAKRRVAVGNLPGGAPSGAATGDLGGTYPAPTVDFSTSAGEAVEVETLVSPTDPHVAILDDPTTLSNMEYVVYDSTMKALIGAGVAALSGTTDPNDTANCTAVGQVYTHTTYGVKFDCSDATNDTWIPRGQQLIAFFGSDNTQIIAGDGSGAGDGCFQLWSPMSAGNIQIAMPASSASGCGFVFLNTDYYLTGIQFNSRIGDVDAADLDVGECVFALGADNTVQTSDPPAGGTASWALPFVRTHWSADLANMVGGNPGTGENEAWYFGGNDSHWVNRFVDSSDTGTLAMNATSTDIGGVFHGCDLSDVSWRVYGIPLFD